MGSGVAQGQSRGRTATALPYMPVYNLDLFKLTDAEEQERQICCLKGS
jgi:hypothetical protein